MSLTYRPARAQDLATTEALVVASINDLTERHGFGPMATASPPNFQLFSLKEDPDGLWVAEDGGDILGFAWSWMCGDVWFLAQLFVDPAQQGRGIGNELLKLTLEHARKSRAAHKALITFTFNRVSQGLYIRHGLFPKMPIYFFAAARERVMAELPEPPLRSVAIDDTAAHMKRLAEIDARAVGVVREKHHRYLLNDLATTGVMLWAGSECVGYTYIGSDGHIGPLAVTRADVLGDAFTTALKMAADSSFEKISAFLPGTCDSALSLAVNHGMRITFPMLLMASPGYGDWTTAQAVVDVVFGRIDMQFGTLPPTVALIKDGRIRGIGVTGRNRAVALPAVPTFIEQGHPNFEAVLWQGIAAPAGTPAAIIARFNREMTAVLTMPEVRQSLLEQGFDAEPGPPEAMLARLKDDIERWRAVAAKANLTKP